MNPTTPSKSLVSFLAGSFTGIAARAVAGIVFSLFLVVGSHAQDISESHLNAARAAVEATRSSQRFDNILPAIADDIQSKLISNQPDQEPLIDKVVEETALELAPRRGDLETEIATVYAKSFTEDELNSIAEFFKSEAGSRFLKLSPVLLRELDKASKVWAQGIARDMNLKVGEKLRDAGKAAAAKGAEGGEQKSEDGKAK